MAETLTWIFWIATGATIYPYIVYPLLLLLLKPLLARQSSQPDDQYRPNVSLILAAYNEERHILQKMENCLALDYPRDKLDILVGSDGSVDATNEITKRFSKHGVRLFEHQQRTGKMAVVNRLVTEATGDICVFSDVSELFDHDALLHLVRHFADPNIGAVTGNHLYDEEDSALSAGTRFYWRFQRLLQSIESQLATICMCDGTIYAVRRSLYTPPANNTINDDVAVPLSIILQGKRVIFDAKAVARGKVPQRTSHFFLQKIRSQSGKYQNFVQFPRMLVPWPVSRFWIYFSHSVMPVVVPWLLILTLLSNGLLVGLQSNSLFTWFLYFQGAFYILALLGLITERTKWRLPFTTIPFYFVTANLGSLFGFFMYLSGGQSAAWRKVE